MLFICSFLW
jgi:hypothetical protein